MLCGGVYLNDDVHSYVCLILRHRANQVFRLSIYVDLIHVKRKMHIYIESFNSLSFFLFLFFVLFVSSSYFF